MWVFPKIGVPQNGWCIMETLLKWMIWGHPYFWKHPCTNCWYVRTSQKNWLQNAWPPRWAHLGIWNTSSYWVWAYPPWSWHSPWKWMLGRLFSFSEGLFSWAMLLLGNVSINKYSCRTHLGRCPFPFPLFLVGGHDQEEAWSHLPSGEATWPHVVRFQSGEENPYGFHWISMDFFKRINPSCSIRRQQIWGISTNVKCLQTVYYNFL